MAQLLAFELIEALRIFGIAAIANKRQAEADAWVAVRIGR